MGTTTMNTRTKRRGLFALTAALALLGLTERAEAQEILLTGPLAGAPAVRKLRLYRKGRFEAAPAVSFTLLDEYQRTILFGARLNYNVTDWFAVGLWGGFGGVKIATSLTEETQAVNADRRKRPPDELDRRLTAVNMGPDLQKQLGGMDWVIAPQVTGVPFRGKLSLFQNIHVDADLYFFAGPAFVGLTERKDCKLNQCTSNASFGTASRMQIAPTFGLGFTFYVNKWNAIGFEWRGLPFKWNTAGFDTRGSGANSDFPDNQIDSQDRQFKFNQMLTLSYNFYFPREYKLSE